MLPAPFVYVLGVILFLTLTSLLFRRKKPGADQIGKFLVIDKEFFWKSSGYLSGIVVKLKKPDSNEAIYSFNFPPDHQSINTIRVIGSGDVIELCPVKKTPGSPDILESGLAVKRLVSRH